MPAAFATGAIHPDLIAAAAARYKLPRHLSAALTANPMPLTPCNACRQIIATPVPSWSYHESHCKHRVGRFRGHLARRVSRSRAEDHLHAELGRGRRSCAVFLRAEDGLL